jgi:hypothetical protein
MLLGQKLLGIKGLETKNVPLRGGVAADVCQAGPGGHRKTQN